MEQTCNVSYTAQIENMDSDQFDEFERALPLAPGVQVKKRSKGVEGLMALMNQGKG